MCCNRIRDSLRPVFAAENKAFQASLTPDVAILDKTERIEGLTLSIWGCNPQTSIALGLINGTSEDSKGISIGFANYGQMSTEAYSWVSPTPMTSSKGLQLGVINSAKKTSSGNSVRSF